MIGWNRLDITYKSEWGTAGSRIKESEFLILD